jgi:dextranase
VGIRVVDFYPLKAYYRPGERLTFRAEVESSSRRVATVRLSVAPAGGDAHSADQEFELGKGVTAVDLSAAVPRAPRRGYLAEVVVNGGGDSVFATTTTDVLRSWTDDPRYGFLSEFSPDDRGIEDRVARTARFHLNCLQFYDWMYRHYRLLPPRDVFTDALGRHLSMKTVRRGIEAAHRNGAAALAYAAVYAAEPEFFRLHKRWGWYRADGASHMLGELFHLMDLTPRSPWVRLMIGELRRTLAKVAFDGFHLDQYGFPRLAYTSDGQVRDVAVDFASFVEAAASVVLKDSSDAGLIFNCVNAWPVERIAKSREAATYVEVWPPHVTYADLVTIVRRCHDLAPGKPVILAAYASFLKAKPDAHQAAASLAMLSAVIFGAGAWHLLLGEGQRALTEAYYPQHVGLPDEATNRLRRIYDFAVGYREFLRDPALRDVAATFIDGAEPNFGASLPFASVPAQNRIWVGLRSKPGWTVVSLVNLLDETDLSWDRAKNVPKPRIVQLRLPDDVRIERCLVATPDGEGSLAPAVCRPGGRDGQTIEVSLSTWTLVLVQVLG